MNERNDGKTEQVLPNTPSKCTWTLGSDIKESPHKHIPLPAVEEKILPNVLSRTGNTPMVRINKLGKDAGLKCELLAKCEYFNAGGSVKDRIGRRMIEDAEEKGLIKPGDVIIEATAGNTGIGLALAACVKGYKCIFVMPEYMSMDKVDILHVLGAEIVRSPTATTLDSSDSLFGVAHSLSKEIPNSIILDQFRNAENPLAHYDETAEEILSACDGKLDMFIACTATGGTITGVGRKLKEKCPQCKIIAVTPESSKRSELEGVQGAFVATTMDPSVIDEIIECSDKDSFLCARRLIREEGLLCGGSSGSAMSVALTAAKELDAGQRCVVLIADSARNYLTKFISDDWMIERDYVEKDGGGASAGKQLWKDMKVSSLDIKYSMTVLSSHSCEDCIDIMKKEGLSQMVVVDETGQVLGMVTLGNINAQLKAEKVDKSTVVSSVTYKQFQKITLDTTLGKLYRIFDADHFSIVVNDQKQSSDSDDPSKQMFAIVKKYDLLKLISKQQEAE
ncbi:cystathionine beta-synthase-like [Saccoglossus kowalevskii]|uniref:Cystathionine beta-synthase n=1 Tax=Saccoglossus kowalevskii TaxID=10224 RepID=A0ABM0H1Q1_SACKO|nr:PREDICTED: cystathionine beta-synthase-like [Saccoglossus kowalevskii]